MIVEFIRAITHVFFSFIWETCTTCQTCYGTWTTNRKSATVWVCERESERERDWYEMPHGLSWIHNLTNIFRIRNNRQTHSSDWTAFTLPTLSRLYTGQRKASCQGAILFIRESFGTFFCVYGSENESRLDRRSPPSLPSRPFFLLFYAFFPWIITCFSKRSFYPVDYMYISRIRWAPHWLQCFLWGETLNQSISKWVLCDTGSWWCSCWFEPYRSHFFICTKSETKLPFNMLRNKIWPGKK